MASETTKDRTLALRQAFEDGARWRWSKLVASGVPVGGNLILDNDEYQQEKRRRYPLHTTRPRVVPDCEPEFDQVWRVVDGEIQWQLPKAREACWRKLEPVFGGYLSITTVTPGRLRLWADLLEQPTETVEAEG